MALLWVSGEAPHCIKGSDVIYDSWGVICHKIHALMLSFVWSSVLKHAEHKDINLRNITWKEKNNLIHCKQSFILFPKWFWTLFAVWSLPHHPDSLSPLSCKLLCTWSCDFLSMDVFRVFLTRCFFVSLSWFIVRSLHCECFSSEYRIKVFPTNVSSTKVQCQTKTKKKWDPTERFNQFAVHAACDSFLHFLSGWTGNLNTEFEQKLTRLCYTEQPNNSFYKDLTSFWTFTNLPIWVFDKTGFINLTCQLLHISAGKMSKMPSSI